MFVSKIFQLVSIFVSLPCPFPFTLSHKSHQEEFALCDKLTNLRKDRNQWENALKHASMEGGRVTRASRNGNRNVNYDMGYHPMDEWTRPKRAAKRQSKSMLKSGSEERLSPGCQGSDSGTLSSVEEDVDRDVTDRPSIGKSGDARGRNLRTGKIAVNHDMKYHPMDVVVKPEHSAKRRSGLDSKPQHHLNVVIQDSDSDSASPIREDLERADAAVELHSDPLPNYFDDRECANLQDSNHTFKLQAQRLRAYCDRVDKPTNAFERFRNTAGQRPVDSLITELSRKHLKRKFVREDASSDDIKLKCRRKGSRASQLSPIQSESRRVSDCSRAHLQKGTSKLVGHPSGRIRHGSGVPDFERECHLISSGATDDEQSIALDQPVIIEDFGAEPNLTQSPTTATELQHIASEASAYCSKSDEESSRVEERGTSSMQSPSASTLNANFSNSCITAPKSTAQHLLRPDTSHDSDHFPESSTEGSSTTEICTSVEKLLEDGGYTAETQTSSIEQLQAGATAMEDYVALTELVDRGASTNISDPWQDSSFYDCIRVIPEHVRNLIANASDTVLQDIRCFVNGLPTNIRDMLLTAMLSHLGRADTHARLTVMKPYCEESTTPATKISGSPGSDLSTPMYLQLSQTSFLARELFVDDRYSSSPPESPTSLKSSV